MLGKPQQAVCGVTMEQVEVMVYDILSKLVSKDVLRTAQTWQIVTEGSSMFLMSVQESRMLVQESQMLQTQVDNFVKSRGDPSRPLMMVTFPWTKRSRPLMMTFPWTKRMACLMFQEFWMTAVPERREMKVCFMVQDRGSSVVARMEGRSRCCSDGMFHFLSFDVNRDWCMNIFDVMNK